VRVAGGGFRESEPLSAGEIGPEALSATHPDLDLKKPLCKGAGIEATPRRDAKGQLKGVNFLPAKKLSGKWISLQGELDQVCPAPATQEFIATVPGAGIVMLPKVGHGYSVEKNWIPQYEAAYERITAAPR
jgi:hypothetical protein